MSRAINLMRSLKFMDLDVIAGGIGVNVATVYRWRKGDTAPKAIQVYGICSLLRLRPTTFTPYTGHPVVYRTPSDAEGVAPEVMGEWVRERIDKCRKRGDWVTSSVLARRCRLNPRTVTKCIRSDDIRWDLLLRFIVTGLWVFPHDLMDVSAEVPIPHIGEGFADYTEAFAVYTNDSTQQEPSDDARDQ